jgi:hypothetical protein
VTLGLRDVPSESEPDDQSAPLAAHAAHRIRTARALGRFPGSRAEGRHAWLKNGDRIIGEVKGLSRALLSYSTDNMQTVSVEWNGRTRGYAEYSRSSSSPAQALRPLVTAPAGYPVVASDTLPLGLRPHLPMSRRFWSRLDGYVDLGFTYQRANHSLQLTFDPGGLPGSARPPASRGHTTRRTRFGGSQLTLFDHPGGQLFWEALEPGNQSVI